MRKQKLSFQQEEENTLHFLQKLNSFQNVSQNLKEKNQVAVHQVEWKKQYERNYKQQQNLFQDLNASISLIDQEFSSFIEANDIFEQQKLLMARGGSKAEQQALDLSFAGIFADLSSQSQIFDSNLWYQVQSFRQIVQEVNSAPTTIKKLDNQQLSAFKNEIKQFFTQIGEITEDSLQTYLKTSQNLTPSLFSQGSSNVTLDTGSVSSTQSATSFLPEIQQTTQIPSSNQNFSKQQTISSTIPITTDGAQDALKNDFLFIGDEDDEYDQNFQKETMDEVGEAKDDNGLAMMLFRSQSVKGFDQNVEKWDYLGDEGIIQYFKVLSEQFELQDQEKSILDNYLKAQDLIQERYQLEIQRVENQFQQVIGPESNLEIPKFMKDSEGKANYDKFIHVYRTYVKRGLSRELYMERLKMVFPKITQAHLESVDLILTKKEFKTQKLCALYRNFISEKNDFKDKAEEQIINLINLRIEESKQNLDQYQVHQESLRITEELQEKKKLFLVQQKEKQDYLKSQRKRRQEQEKKQKEEWNEHAKIIKQDAIEFQDEKKIKIEKQIKQQREREFKLKQEKLREIQENQPQVDIRQQNEINKLYSKLAEQQENEQLQQYNEQRIQQAIEGYSIRPHVEIDHERVKRPTEAIINQQNTVYDKADQIDLVKVHGYNMGDLMKDMRFRLGIALHDAGVHQTSYANSVLNFLSKTDQ